MIHSAPQPPGACEPWQPLCRLDQLQERGPAIPFDVVYAGQTCRAFAILYQGQPHAYLNRCTHVPMELDWQPNQVFDLTGRWLLCATHGAHYRPDTGACASGPCRKGLVKIRLDVRDGVVGWHPDHLLRPV